MPKSNNSDANDSKIDEKHEEKDSNSDNEADGEDTTEIAPRPVSKDKLIVSNNKKDKDSDQGSKFDLISFFYELFNPNSKKSSNSDSSQLSKKILGKKKEPRHQEHKYVTFALSRVGEIKKMRGNSLAQSKYVAGNLKNDHDISVSTKLTYLVYC